MLLFHSEVSLGIPGYAYVKELLFAIFYERYVGFVFLVSSVVIILANFFDFSNFVGVNHFIGQLSNKVIISILITYLYILTLHMMNYILLYFLSYIVVRLYCYAYKVSVSPHVYQYMTTSKRTKIGTFNCNFITLPSDTILE
ncbi:Hypothetical_protein [Hexamita inflata]|uniref:Hypothetical_protein n=1 Tax=Hexamita inflata TaxID=28002 RepID=A0AA86REH9_9EUKA|nr:Hypothetical protein HINF_LOCUS53485 [Hexamita inflata]